MSLPLLPESCSHVLAELDSLDPLLSALRLDSSRLKCACLSVSRKWLALGSSAGGLHLIQKEGWKQRFMLTHKEGALTRVACCQHDEDYVVVATSQGHVIVWELHQERRGKPERIYVSSEHKGRQVTALCWDTTALRVFVGDNLGKVSGLKVNSSKQGKAAAFVMFPVQVITTVDSRVVQLDYLEGKLLVSSLTRCYLCDTDREKFWKIGSKERDGEFGACFLPGSKNVGFLQPLIFCARPGSRMWEVNFEGEVMSTHQFKQLLGSPPLPIITHRSELHYSMTSCSPQSISFPRLLCLSENYVLSWTDRGIYVFIPQTVQVLLWSELKDVQNISVYKNELFCLHTDGRVTHLCLWSGERCIERLLQRDMWTLAAQVCCLFQHCIIASRTRKLLPVDRLEHLKSQLDAATQSYLVARLEEVLVKLEPFDSACSSRRSSFSSHESFNVLDSGIYRVISRRGSQSDEDSGSLHSHLSEEERLREFTSVQEEEQREQDNVSHSSLNIEGDRSETLIPFHLPLSFRSTSPRVSLQAMKESVSSFVKKTKETISTLHPNSDFRVKPEIKDGELQCEVLVTPAARIQDLEHDLSIGNKSQEVDKLQELRLATAEAVVKLQDPLVLFDTSLLKEALQCWLPHLEKTFQFKVKTQTVHDISTSEEDSTVFSHREEEKSSAFDHKELEVPAVLSHQGGEEELPTFSHQEDEEEPAAFFQQEEEGGSMSLCFQEEEKQPTSVLSQRWIREPEVDSDLISHQEQREESVPFAHQEQEGPILNHGEEMMEEGVTPKDPVVDDEPFSVELSNVPFVTIPFCSIPTDLFKDMTELSTLCFEMGIFDSMTEDKFPATELPEIGTATQACLYMRNYFFLLDLMRVKRSITAHNWSTPLVWQTLILGLQEITQSHPISNTIKNGDLRKVLKLLGGEKQSRSPFLLAHAARLHLLEAILQPKSRKLDWLQLAVSHDAPQRTDTTDIDGNPRPHSHRFTWGYAQLIGYFTQLPGDLETKKKMLDICKSYGFWPAYLSLCLQLCYRVEAFTVIVYLDDISLFDEQNGLMPETLEEWNFVLELVRNHRDITRCIAMQNGDSVANGDSDWSNSISLENVALLLAKTIGPDRALTVLHDRGLQGDMSERFVRVCDILRIGEKRQRALVQSMLERCDRFLLSQQA
ncbi:Hermansky-Pudlak syndrome 5 protein isoform X2 [Carcharodon carcharias]|uniref:Hermansky-Pudlak syndrome 5 protein isoform X2 n=1 Tax=Carcharodon carcharias TaxID=13397 RepID=UPI001B7D94F0|nr:Hermansky-Pudlak syndrome 5 protein isoform X2 [Carcharodon carcharias]